MAQDVTSVDEVLPALARVLQAIAERVRRRRGRHVPLLTADFPGRDALLRAYQENGIERGTAMLAAWFQRLARRGLIQVSPRVVAGCCCPWRSPNRCAPWRWLTPPLPESSIGERIQACLALFAGDARSSRCARVMRCARRSAAARQAWHLAKHAHGDTLNRQRRVPRDASQAFFSNHSKEQKPMAKQLNEKTAKAAKNAASVRWPRPPTCRPPPRATSPPR